MQGKLFAMFLLVLALVAVLAACDGRPDAPGTPDTSGSSEVTSAATEPGEPAAGSGSISLIYMLAAKVSLSDGRIELYFQNPSVSDYDVVLEAYAVLDGSERKLAESGLISSGDVLTEMRLIDGSDFLSEGQYEGKFRVIYYDRETGRRVIDSEIDGLSITVLP